MISRFIIKALAIYSFFFLILISVAILTSDATNNEKAIIKMAIALNILWVGICGGLMYKYRVGISKFVRAIPINWKVKFFGFSLTLILIEEAITTTLTNLAPLFGGEIGKAFITGSTNYFEVIFFHSAIMFVPFILVWIWLLSRYDFSVGQVFLLFGLLGTIGEAMLSPYALISGFWFFVYGLFVFLPTYSLPQRYNLKRPGIKAYLIAIIVPILISAPMSLIVIGLQSLFGIQSLA